MSAMLWPVAAMLALLTMSSMSVFTASVLAPEVAPALGVDAHLIGVFTAIVYVVAMASGTVTGNLVRRHGAIRVCQATMVCNALGLALLAMETVPATLAAASALGLAYGPFNPASAHVLAGLATRRWRPFVFSVKQTGVPLGGALAGAVVPWLTLRHGWHEASLAVASGSLVVLALVQPLRARFDVDLRPARISLRSAVLVPVRLALAGRRSRRYTLGAFCLAGCQVSVGAFMVVYLTERFAMGIVQAGALFACLQVGAVVGRLAWGSVAGARASPARVLLVIATVEALCLTAAPWLSPAWPAAIIVGLATVLGATSFGWNGVLLAEVAGLAPPGRASEATGGMQFVMFAGVVIVPPLFGAGVSLTGGYTTPFLALAALAAVGGWLIGSAGGQQGGA
jgi:MFS family permease